MNRNAYCCFYSHRFISIFRNFGISELEKAVVEKAVKKLISYISKILNCITCEVFIAIQAQNKKPDCSVFKISHVTVHNNVMTTKNILKFLHS